MPQRLTPSSGASNSLDALCARYGIDNSRRTKHGALLDAQILAEVYIELLGGKQTSLGLGTTDAARAAPSVEIAGASVSAGPRIMRQRLSTEERARHAAFLATLGETAIWRDYLGEDGAPP